MSEIALGFNIALIGREQNASSNLLCPHCGKQVVEGTNICSGCGMRLIHRHR
jgi:predicted amidophosphoribosyltransferase